MKFHQLYPIATVTAAFAAYAAIGQDQSSRAGRFEVYGSGEYETDSNGNIHSRGFRIPVHYDDFWGGGAGFGYNLDAHWNLNGTANFGSVGATTGLPDAAVHSDAFESVFNLNVDYNFFATRFTPFLTAGGAMAIYDDRVESPNFVLDYTEAAFGVNGGAGLRFEIDDHWFVKAAYRAVWREGADRFHGDNLVHTANVSLGYTF